MISAQSLLSAKNYADQIPKGIADFYLYSAIAVLVSNIALIPQILLILSSGNYKGISFGFLLFGFTRAFLEYQTQGDFDLVNDLSHYGGIFVLGLVATFFWVKDAKARPKVLNFEKGEKVAAVENFFGINLPYFDSFNYVYIAMLLVTLFGSFALFKFGIKMTISAVLILIPLLRLGEPLCQLIHIRRRQTLDGVSVWSVLLLIAAPVFGMIATLSVSSYIDVQTLTGVLVFGVANEFPSFLLNAAILVHFFLWRGKVQQPIAA